MWLTGPTPAGRRPRCFLVLSYADSQIRPPRTAASLRACDPFAGGAGGVRGSAAEGAKPPNKAWSRGRGARAASGRGRGPLCNHAGSWKLPYGALCATGPRTACYRHHVFQQKNQHPACRLQDAAQVISPHCTHGHWTCTPSFAHLSPHHLTDALCRPTTYGCVPCSAPTPQTSMHVSPLHMGHGVSSA